MNPDGDLGLPEIEILLAFLAAYEAASDPPAVLEEWCRRHPPHAATFRLLAQFHEWGDIPIPETMAGIELLYPVDEGGAGVVYEGFDARLGRTVAVKLCLVLAPPAERNAFFHEYQTLARLHHSSIPPVYHAGREGLWLHGVMPRIQGLTLAAIVEQARAILPQQLPTVARLVTMPRVSPTTPMLAAFHAGTDYLCSVVETLLQAVDAVVYAHQEGVWHLDIKPANLMLEANGHCWLIDFGVAQENNTELRPVAGMTPHYAAPEQWRGEPSEQSDVWALGVTLYELLTLRRPFDGHTAPDSTRLPPVRSISLDVDLDLQAIGMKALAMDPLQRYRASELAADLRRWLAHDEPEARPWPRLRRFWKVARRHWQATVTVLLIFGSIITTLLALLINEQNRTKRRNAEAETAQTRAALEREEAVTARGRAWEAIAQAQRELESTTAGRRVRVQQLLRAAAKERRLLTNADDVQRLNVVLRSTFVRSVGLLDIELPPPGTEFVTPERETSNAWDWPVDLHPQDDQLVIGTTQRPKLWKQREAPPTFAQGDGSGERARVVYGPVGNVLAESGGPTRGGLRLWDRSATTLLGELLPPGASVTVLAVGFDAKETRLWAACTDGRFRSWLLPALTPAPDWPLPKTAPARCTAAAWSRDGTILAVGDARGHVMLVDAQGNESARIVAPTRRQVDALAWSPDRQQVAVGTSDGNLHVARADGSPMYRVLVSSAGVSHVRFSPDGQWLTAHHRNYGSRLWDAQTGQLVLMAHDPIWGFSSDSKRLAMAGTRSIGFGTLIVPEAFYKRPGHLASVEHLTWAADGSRFATLASDYELRVWDVAEQKTALRMILAPPSDQFYAYQAAIALSPDGQQVGYASGGLTQATARVWDVATGDEKATWTLPGGFDKLAGLGHGRFLSVREELSPRDERNNVTTVIRELEVGQPVPPGQLLRPAETYDQRRFMDHWLLPNGRHYLWAGPRKPAANRRIELYDLQTKTRVWRLTTPTDASEAAPNCTLPEALKPLWVMDGTNASYRYDSPPQAFYVKNNDQVRAVAANGILFGQTVDDARQPAIIVRQEAGVPWLEFPVAPAQLPTGGNYLFNAHSRYLAWGTMSGAVYVLDFVELNKVLEPFERGLDSKE